MSKMESLALKVFSTSPLGVKCRIDETSLLIPDGTSFEAVEQMFSAMTGLKNCVQWYIGDLLVFAERQYGEKYAQLLDATDYEYHSLCNICYVATRIAPQVRCKQLSFAHHRVVAPLQIEDQKKYLKIAIDQKLSAAGLRDLVLDKNKEPKPNRAETYELALKSILKIANKCADFDEVEFKERPSKMSNGTLIAATASDALKAFED
ncbi:MAG: hypothetical protein WC373_04740 [Smithella sp.]|jgi:hypothetical protein